jgi:hypothetical protein
MYDGYVFFCSKKDVQECLSAKRYSCESKAKPADPIKEGSVVFLYNTEDKTLIGPFTAMTEGGDVLDTGTWAMDIDVHIPSEDVKVTWEDVHIIKDAEKDLPFLAEAKTCKLGFTQTQRVLDMLKRGKFYFKPEKEKT